MFILLWLYYYHIVSRDAPSSCALLICIFFSFSSFLNLLTNFKLGYNHHNWRGWGHKRGSSPKSFFYTFYFYFCLALMITNRLHVQLPPKHPTAANGHEQGWVHGWIHGQGMTGQRGVRYAYRCVSSSRYVFLILIFTLLTIIYILHIQREHHHH